MFLTSRVTLFSLDSVVYTPKDGDNWMIAKLNVQITDLGYSQIVEHLAKVCMNCEIFRRESCFSSYHFSHCHPSWPSMFLKSLFQTRPIKRAREKKRLINLLAELTLFLPHLTTCISAVPYPPHVFKCIEFSRVAAVVNLVFLKSELGARCTLEFS